MHMISNFPTDNIIGLLLGAVLIAFRENIADFLKNDMDKYFKRREKFLSNPNYKVRPSSVATMGLIMCVINIIGIII